MRSGRNNLKGYELWMCIRPRHRFSFCFKKPVDHDGIELARRSSASTSGLAINHCRSGVDRGADAIGKNNFAPVRNSVRIDRAMSGTQTLPGAGVVGALTRPITGNASKDRLLAGESY